MGAQMVRIKAVEGKGGFVFVKNDDTPDGHVGVLGIVGEANEENSAAAYIPLDMFEGLLENIERVMTEEYASIECQGAPVMAVARPTVPERQNNVMIVLMDYDKGKVFFGDFLFEDLRSALDEVVKNFA